MNERAPSAHPDAVPKAGPTRSIAGVSYEAGFWPDHERTLAWTLANVRWDERIRARKTASFGEPYDYAGLDYARAGFPPELEAVRVKVAERIGLGFNNCLLNYYPDGRSRMGFHADAEAGIVPGTGVAIVSLGAQRNLRFRRTDRLDERLDYVLEPGSLVFMEPEVQRVWQHALPRSSARAPRVSLTFRVLICG